uniref:Secreted protein n=1 Tax=Ixodes ricinus TaxID=34613 RepID=A0A6B0V7X5_IXORI
MLSSWLSCWHMALMLLGFSLTGEDSGIGGTEKPLWREGRSPEASRDMARCRSMLEGSSLSRRDSCLLKGDVWLRLPKPRKEPCLCSIETVACGRSIAYGFTTDFTGGASDGLASCGSWGRLSVMEPCRKEPVRVKLEVLGSKFISTLSLSRFCLRSRHTANAQPTAWLSRSPESLTARKPWHIQRRVVPSLQMYEKPRSWLRSGAQNDTFSMVWSTRSPLVPSSTTRSPSPVTCKVPRTGRRLELRSTFRASSHTCIPLDSKTSTHPRYLTGKVQLPARTAASSACHWWGLLHSGTCSLRPRRRLSRRLRLSRSIPALARLVESLRARRSGDPPWFV